jgi:hypothetical protein
MDNQEEKYYEMYVAVADFDVTMEEFLARKDRFQPVAALVIEDEQTES